MSIDPKATRGYRNRNPGNIEHVPANKWQGLAEPPSDGRFCRFTSHEFGIRALAVLLLAYATALFGRYAENTAKLAMLAAISRDPASPVTQPQDVTWASHLVEHCIATLLREAERRVSDNDTEAKHKRLLAIIRDGGRQSRSDITRRSQFLSRREREEIVASLIEAGLVVMEVEPGTTKPTAYYTATTPTGTAIVRHGEP